MKIIGHVTDSRGVVHPVPSYKPGGLLKDTKVERVTEKSDFLKRLEAKQQPVVIVEDEKVLKFPASNR